MINWQDRVYPDISQVLFRKFGACCASLVIALSAGSSSAQSSDGIVVIDSFDTPLGNASYVEGSCNASWTYANFPNLVGPGILGTRSASAYKGQNDSCIYTGVDVASDPVGSLRVNLSVWQSGSWAEARLGLGYTGFGSLRIEPNSVIVIEGVGTGTGSSSITVGISSLSGSSSLTRPLGTGSVGTLAFPISDFVGNADLAQITSIGLTYSLTGTWGYALQSSYSANRLILASADCNNDGVVDYGQILAGQLSDDNANWIPDICETSVTGVSPPSVPAQGGAALTIRGNNFPDNPAVLVGGVPATDVVRLSATRITATSPALLPGMAAVKVSDFTLQEAIYIRPECGSDLDQDGEVTSADIAIVLLDFGPCYSNAANTQPQDSTPFLLQDQPAAVVPQAR